MSNNNLEDKPKSEKSEKSKSIKSQQQSQQISQPSISLMERNLQKMRTLTQKLIAPNVLEGHSESVIEQLKQMILPQPSDDLIHITETLEEAHNMQFLSQPIQIIQGQLQDRELLNAMALIVSHQQLFNTLYIIDEEQDRYIFKLYKKNQRYSVIIDPYIYFSGHLPKYSRSGYNSIWVSLLEKALSNILGGYDQLVGISLRDSIRNLCGLDPEIIVYENPDNVNQKQLQQTLSLLQKNGSIVGFMQINSIGFNKNQKVQSSFLPTLNQIYVFESIQENKVKIINHFQVSQHEITIKDITQNFNCIVIIKDFPDDYRGLFINITTTTHGVPGNNQQWINNPSYQMVINTQNETQFIFRLSELENQDGITGLLLVNQRDVRTFNQNNVVFMTKQNIVQIGQRKQNYSCFSVKIKGFHTLFVFSTSKEPKLVLLEIFYAGRPSQIEFKFKSKPIIEFCVGEPQDSEGLRILRDVLKDKDLIIGNFKNQILNNPNQPVSSKTYNDVIELDQEMACIQENQLQEELLGINLEGKDPQETEIYDFNDYQLTDEGFQIILPDLIAEPVIKELRLRNNQLHDESILQLCYELDKSYHLELEFLDVSQNQLTKKSNEVLNNLKKRLKNLQKIIQ
ncbi:unnamed protein product [Paramecium pentaurelia]|uniref:Calpain catalytic domain-containing protein n=1 Tax=Paramecium pentaurelia TaxID=43138 RepID=A0A8S1RY33_9CILI|nr:unnamed protein product [Paramecium pentaurelia]